MGPVDDLERSGTLSLVAGVAATVVGAGATGDAAVGTAPAALVCLVGVGLDDDVLVMAGWLAAGAVLGGVVGYGAVAAGSVPLSTGAGAGLGIALGGGLGVVANLVAADAEATDRTETVEVEADDEPPSPRPADLFDDHPDPVLYVNDDGAGPVVRAANDAFADTFDLGTGVLTGAPLDEALSVTDRSGDVLAAVEAGESVDLVVDCQTPAGERAFRLRVAGDDDCYVLFTPVEW